jgi:MFS family permease
MSPRIQFALFHVLFFASMWLSKTIHPLFFEQAQTMTHFSLGYSAMAMAGYFSFIIGYYCDRMGYRWSLALGCLFYSVGLALRCFPQSSWVCVASGLVGGFGASAALSSMRVWMLDISTEKERARFIGTKSSMVALGTAVGCLLAGVLADGFFHLGLKNTLMLASVVMLGLAVLSGLFLRTHKTAGVNSNSKQEKRALWHFMLQNKNLAFWTTLIGVFAGFYVSFVSPYLPVILKNKGFDLLSVGLSTAAFSLVRFLVDPWIGKWMEARRDQAFRVYLTAEAVILLVTATFLIPLNPTSFVLFLFVRSLGLGFSTISEELTWLQIFPKESLGLCFGLNQSGFFIGDFLGGLINGRVFDAFGMQGCAGFALVIMILNAGLFMVFMRKTKSAQSAQMELAPCAVS